MERTIQKLKEKIGSLENSLALQSSKTKRALLEKSEYIAIFSHAPLFILLVNDKIRVIDMSLAVTRLSGKTKEEVVDHGPGEALNCTNRMDAPGGCGWGPLCGKCTIRAAIGDTLDTGQGKTRVSAKFSFSGPPPAKMNFLVSTTALNGVDPRRAAVFMEDVTDNKQSEEKIRKSLKEKETLLREIHHRVKNNIQTVASLLSLQSDTSDDPKVIHEFRETEIKVRSMAIVHEMIYQSNAFSEIPLQDYLDSLVDHLFHVYTGKGTSVQTGVEAGDVILKVEHAVPCGLIVAELLTNSVKYAVPPSSGLKIKIKSRYDAGGSLVMVISDNGVRPPEGFDPLHSKTLGLRLVTEIITDQLEGTFRVDLGAGVCWIIQWPIL